MQTLSVVSKPWGKYEVLYDTKYRLIKILTVNPGQILSEQSHEYRAEHWFVLSGSADVELEGEAFTLEETQSINVPVKGRHRLINSRAEPLRVLEVQYGTIIDEDDIVRYKDRYGRATVTQGGKGMALEKPVVIAEIGCNHKGDIDVALEMIKVAAQFCDVDVAKFQKRTNKELLSEEEYHSPHPNPINSYGDTYGAHREFLEFSIEQHKKLKAACEEWGIAYSTSVWDLTSAKEITSLNPVLIKIPSAINTDFQVLDYLAREYKGEIHISLGMTTNEEKEQILGLLSAYNRLKDVVLYHCVSGYPVEDEELFLMEIVSLKEQYGDKVKAIGFSGHHKGIAADVAALTLGAEYFERHFTMDRTWKGTDHAASLEPDGMRRLTRNIKSTLGALRYKKSEIIEIEEEQRKKLKKRRSL